jgi:hypothetical protein
MAFTLVKLNINRKIKVLQYSDDIALYTNSYIQMENTRNKNFHKALINFYSRIKFLTEIHNQTQRKCEQLRKRKRSVKSWKEWMI